MNLVQVFAHARTLLEPGGHLAFVEAVWTEQITAAVSSELHDTTQRVFGIPVGSREPLTWRDWCGLLSDFGFETIHGELLPRGSAGHPPTPNWTASIAAMIRDPRLALLDGALSAEKALCQDARRRSREQAVPWKDLRRTSSLHLPRTADL